MILVCLAPSCTRPEVKDASLRRASEVILVASEMVRDHGRDQEVGGSNPPTLTIFKVRQRDPMRRAIEIKLKDGTSRFLNSLRQ